MLRRRHTAGQATELASQELHTDADNGPFSFTLSLTRWDGRRFTGGETVLLAPRVLDYWAAPLSAEVRLICMQGFVWA